MTAPTGNPPGRRKGYGRGYTVLVSCRVSPVLASRIERERRDGETLGTAARRLLGERLGVGGDDNDKEERKT